MQNNKNIRFLKVCKAWTWREKLLGNWLAVPKINLKGLWLEKAGFTPSTIIHVEVLQGKMIITKKERKEWSSE